MAKRERQPFKLAGTVDIECAGWTTFVLGACYDGHRPKVFYELDALIDHLIRVGGVWLAHAGGIYDFMAILDRLLERGISAQCDRSQHRVTRIVSGHLTLRDSYALWPVPLDDICGALGREIPSLPWPCICTHDCGGYCQITAKAKEGDPDLEDYCIADARALYDGIQLLEEFSSEHKIFLKGTLGQTAWINAQDDLGIPDSEIPFDLWRHIRLADMGGRAQVIRPKASGPGMHHDICNAYPAALAKTPLPVGARRQVGSRTATGCLRNARPGIYSITVRVPEDRFLPPLPWLYGGQMNYPTGEFSGTWALPEIGAAIDRGVEIVKVHSAVVWEATGPVFGELVQRWYDIRRKVGRKTPLGQWIGRLAKTLPGKFAERPERSRVMMHPETIEICNRRGRCANGCTGRCGAYEQLDLFGFIWAIPYEKMAPSAYPEWSAYLRAQTRVQLLSQAELFGKNLCMMNTDSLWTLGRQTPEPLGDDLGQWEFQNAWYGLEALTPSIYAYRTEAPTTRREVVFINGRRTWRDVPELGPMVCRGIPGLTEADWKRGTGVIERGVLTFGRAVATARPQLSAKVDPAQMGSSPGKGLFQKRRRRWSLPSEQRLYFGDRKLSDGGITYPMNASEIRALVAAKRKLKGLAHV